MIHEKVKIDQYLLFIGNITLELLAFDYCNPNRQF